MLVGKTSHIWNLRSPFSKVAHKLLDYTSETPFQFNPYPNYQSWKRWKSGFGRYNPCEGPNGGLIEDIQVFKGRPRKFPGPGMGSYDVLGIDGNLCFERDTRLGLYGNGQLKDGRPLEWDQVDWGSLQRKCFVKNADRYDSSARENRWLRLYPELEPPGDDQQVLSGASKGGALDDEARWRQFLDGLNPDEIHQYSDAEYELVDDPNFDGGESDLRKRWARILPLTLPWRQATISESRTAILLRSYTGKEYTENDKQVIRSLLTEMALRSGGEYEVFLLLHVKDAGIDLHDVTNRRHILEENVPLEFHNITVMWNDETVSKVYAALTDEEARDVHYGQWLSVQWFSMQHSEFDFFWNWEVDSRYTGHHYDLIRKLEEFGKKQPRKGLWERNDRYYIESIHGDYDTTFREMVERLSGNGTVWGAPPVPVVKPVGPKPPVAHPKDDDYEWGVGEEADLITLGPIFNVPGSEWIFDNHVWGYSGENFEGWAIPRRGTIITQARVSKKLLDIMHVENLRGNHVVSEMTPQTVALLHGMKAVYAPHAVFYDRPWSGEFLHKWFNAGPLGTVGGHGSSIGWGREKRYQGSTWYYRAEPPNRLYNNWLGFEDKGIGGEAWEEFNGRACLPPMLLHPVKDTKETPPGYRTWHEIY